MIKKIIVSTFFVLLLFSISLYLAGITHVELGSHAMAFLKNCSRELESFKIAIPNIPSIPNMEDVNGFMVVVDVLVKFINGLVNVLNFIILVLNTLIQLIQFIFIILKNFISMRNEIIA